MGLQGGYLKYTSSLYIPLYLYTCSHRDILASVNTRDERSWGGQNEWTKEKLLDWSGRRYLAELSESIVVSKQFIRAVGKKKGNRLEQRSGCFVEQWTKMHWAKGNKEKKGCKLQKQPRHHHTQMFVFVFVFWSYVERYSSDASG